MDFTQIAAHLQDDSVFPAVLATLVRVEGSSYRREGARLLIAADGRHWGSISGGCLESDLASRAQALITSQKLHDCISYDTTHENDLVWGVGTGCHGIVHVFLETMPSKPSWLDAVLKAAEQRRVFSVSTHWQTKPSAPHDPLGTRIVDTENSAKDVGDSDTLTQRILPCWHLVVFGAGDDAKPLVSLATTLGWETSVIDPRSAYATTERFPTAARVRCLPAEASISALTWDDRTLAVIMTHHYVHDLPLLRALLPMQLPFLGLLGPRARGLRILKDADADPADAALLHAPVGLDLGGDGPAAVALSIIAEIHAHLHHREARPLRERSRPIHADD